MISPQRHHGRKKQSFDFYKSIERTEFASRFSATKMLYKFIHVRFSKLIPAIRTNCLSPIPWKQHHSWNGRCAMQTGATLSSLVLLKRRMDLKNYAQCHENSGIRWRQGQNKRLGAKRNERRTCQRVPSKTPFRVITVEPRLFIIKAWYILSSVHLSELF